MKKIISLFMFAMALIVILFSIFQFNGSSYFVYNVTKSLPKGLYYMGECAKEIKKNTFVNFYKEKPAWLGDRSWYQSSLKMVSGLPGDIVSISKDKSEISICNSDKQCSSFKKYTHLPYDESMIGVIPEGYLFLTGSHSDSLDSRYYGLIERSKILGCGERLF